MSLCDVGGCGNTAIGEEVAVQVGDTGFYLEVSLCAQCGDDLSPFLRDDAQTVEWRRGQFAKAIVNTLGAETVGVR